MTTAVTRADHVCLAPAAVRRRARNAWPARVIPIGNAARHWSRSGGEGIGLAMLARNCGVRVIVGG